MDAAARCLQASRLVASFPIVNYLLSFRYGTAEIEGAYLGELTKQRWPVLLFIFAFDVMCMVFRAAARVHVARSVAVGASETAVPGASVAFEGLTALVKEMAPQAGNMGILYISVGLLNRRSRR